MRNTAEWLTISLFVLGFLAMFVVIGQGIESDFIKTSIPALIWGGSWIIGLILGLLVLLYEKGYEHGKDHSPESD